MTNNYHQKHKERLRKEAREKYENLSKEEKDKRQNKVPEKYQNLSEKQKQKLLKYLRIIIYHIKINY